MLVAFVVLGIVFGIFAALRNWWNTPSHRSGFIVTIAISPDDRTIAFTGRGKGGQDIYILNVARSKVNRLTNSSSFESFPSFSPDGTKIAFSVGLVGEIADHIAIINTDGTNPKQLTHDRANDSFPTFSCDGTRITFTRDSDYKWGGLASNWYSHGEVHVVNVDGTGLTNLTPGTIDGHRPVFSTDDQSVFYFTNRGVSTVPTDGKGQAAHVLSLGDSYSRSLTSDRSQVVFVSGGTMVKSELEIATLDGQKRRQLTSYTPTGGYEEPVVSNSGQYIYFIKSNFIRQAMVRELWRMDFDGGNPIKLAGQELFDDPMAWNAANEIRE